VPSAPVRAALLYETFLAGCSEKAEELDDSSGNFGIFVDSLFSGWVRRVRSPVAGLPGESCSQGQDAHPAQPEEGANGLRSLLERYPELTAEAEQIARAAVSDGRAQAVADDLEAVLDRPRTGAVLRKALTGWSSLATTTEWWPAVSSHYAFDV